MQTAAKDLEALMLKLTVEERLHLLDVLLASLEPEAQAQEAWLKLARQRREEVRVGNVAMVPGSEALARIRERMT